MTDDDNLTYWLKSFLGICFGGAIGMAAVGLALGKEYSQHDIAIRAIILTVGSAILAAVRLLKR